MVLNNARLAFAARGGPGFTQCTVTAGNLVAVDADGADIDPIQTTAFTQVVLSADTSAALLGGDPWTDSDVSDVIGDLTTLLSGQSGLTSDLAGVTTSVNDLTSEVSDLTGYVNNQTSDLAGLLTGQDAIDATLATIQDTLANLSVTTKRGFQV